MPKVDKRGRPRLKVLPKARTIRARAYLAMKGKPSAKKRRDLELMIWLYKTKERFSDNKHVQDAVIRWKERLEIFDRSYYEMKARGRMRKQAIKGKTYEDQIENVIKLLVAGENVKGFTLLRTCKAEAHPTFYPLFSSEQLPSLLPEEMSLCIVRKQHNGKNKSEGRRR